MAASPKTQSSVNTSQKPDHPFSDPTPDSDLILVVEEQKLHVNKVVLSLASPVFKKMFEADFKVKSRKEITLPDKEYTNILEFLLCIYPSTYKPVTGENMDVVLPLAHEYQVQQVVDRCEKLVLTQFQNRDVNLRDPPLQELVHFLFLADRYDLKKLIEVCVEKMAARSYTSGKNVRAAEDMEEFKLVSVKTKYEILLKRMRCIEPLARTLTPFWGKDFETLKSYFAFDKAS